jgi:hypothetical protein
MSESKVTLTTNIIRALLLDIADTYKGYNEAWNWWAYESDEEKVYSYGGGVAKRAQVVNSDSQIELIIELLPDMEDTPVFVRVRGEESSYGRDKWDATVSIVKPTARVIRVYE